MESNIDYDDILKDKKFFLKFFKFLKILDENYFFTKFYFLKNFLDLDSFKLSLGLYKVNLIKFFVK